MKLHAADNKYYFNNQIKVKVVNGDSREVILIVDRSVVVAVHLVGNQVKLCVPSVAPGYHNMYVGIADITL